MFVGRELTELERLSREDLLAENLRLRALLDEAGIQAARQRFRAAEADADHMARLATSRAEAAGYLRHIEDMRAGSGAVRDPSTATGDSGTIDFLDELTQAQAATRTTQERLAFIFEASGSIGWWDWDIRNDRLYSSAGFARLFGVDPDKAARGAPIADFVGGIHPEDRDRIGERIADVVARGGDFAEEYRLLQRDGAVIWIFARGRCHHDAHGQPLRYPGVAVDITERKTEEIRRTALAELGARLREAETLDGLCAASAEILARVLHATRAGIGTVDHGRETVVIAHDWQAPGEASIAGTHRFRDYGTFIDDLKRGEPVIIGDVTTDPRTAGTAEALLSIGIRVLVNLPIMEHGRLVSVVLVHHRAPHRWTDGEIAFLREVGNRTQGEIKRLRAEEQQRLLNRELGHRLKNNLAMVQAIVAQTLRNASDLGSARLSLSNRLTALGRAHELLLSGRIDGTDLQAVAEGTLALHDDGGGRIALDGPAVTLGPAAALSLALMLHELATNAAKYGSLSVPAGRVEIAWRIVEDAGEALLRFTWREANGPPVRAPTRRGFGSRLIERGLAGSIGGRVDLDYRPEGLVCRLSAPLAGLQLTADGA